MRSVFTISTFVLFGTLLISSIPSYSGTDVITNMDMVVSTMGQAADQVLEELDTADNLAQWEGSILLVSQATHNANWLAEHILLERLLERGYQVVLDSTAVETGSARLSYRILNLGILGRSGLIGGDVLRTSHVTLAMRLSETGDEIIHWQSEKTVVNEAAAKKSQLELLQTTSYKFAETDLEEESWGKFVEPIIVTTVLGGLVWLFFSNR